MIQLREMHDIILPTMHEWETMEFLFHEILLLGLHQLRT